MPVSVHGLARADDRHEDTSPLDPQRGALHRILRLHLADFLSERERLGARVPRFVQHELEGYLECGVLAAGCALFECDGCGLNRVTGLSCGGRGFCPRCCGRRMTQRARHLVERVLPEVRIRQWVLSLPFALRIRLAFDHELALALARITTSEIEAHYQAHAHEHGLREPQSGAVTAIQRFGSDLRLNLHFHILYLDGAYVRDAHGELRFIRARAPSPANVESILRRIVERANVLLSGADAEHLEDDELALVQSYAQSVGPDGTEAHAPEDEHHDERGLVLLPTRRKARIEQWDLDAEVTVKEHERETRLEYLCRYILRPPIALDRLKLLADGRVCLELKRPWRDGSTHLTMSPRTFIGRLASLVPRPNTNTILYSGVLAANSTLRRRVVPKREPSRRRHHDSSWAALMKHSFGISILSCPRCKGRLRFVAVLFDRTEIKRLLQHLRMWSEPLPPHPARGPPEYEESFDFP